MPVNVQDLVTNLQEIVRLWHWYYNCGDFIKNYVVGIELQFG